jgi:hypoxanthine phosphoribosyltransferase
MSNGKIMSQYQNAKFLIFDEDINSGATLKLCIDALEEKLPDINKNNVICLVNAYSSKSF